MIDIALDKKVVERFVNDIADKILIPRIDTALAEHKSGEATLLPDEAAFYTDLKKDPKSLLRQLPAELESTFAAWRARYETFVVFASGSLEKIQRHLTASINQAWYDREWRIHQDVVDLKGNANTCTCEFCKVSKRAATVFNWIAFSKKKKPKPAPAPPPEPALAAQFIRAVGFVVCPYCSRNYISPISEAGEVVYRPDLDHFFARSIYPYFGLCPYNLVPSCAACNCRIKGDKDFLKHGYFHPYADTVADELFHIDTSSIITGEKIDPSKIEVKLNPLACTKTRQSAEFFRLTSAYNVHAAEIANFIESIRQFPDKIIEERARYLKVEPAALKVLLYRSTPDDKTLYKTRPLGKLYRDLYLFGRYK